MEQARETGATRIRINFKVSAKGAFQPDITSEAETVEIAMINLDKAHSDLLKWAAEKGYGESNES
jgi:hypothetical protein